MMKIAGESTIRNLRTNQRKDRDHPPHLEQPEKEQNEITKSTPGRERFSVPHAAGDPKILQDRNLENEDMFELIKNPPEIKQSESLNNLNYGIRPLTPLRQ